MGNDPKVRLIANFEDTLNKAKTLVQTVSYLDKKNPVTSLDIMMICLLKCGGKPGEVIQFQLGPQLRSVVIQPKLVEEVAEIVKAKPIAKALFDSMETYRVGELET